MKARDRVGAPRVLRRGIVAVVAVVGATACLGSTPSREPPPNRIVAQNLRLDDGRALRFGVTPSEPFAHVLATFTPDSAGVMLCPLPSLDARLPARTACRADVGSGVRESVTAPGLRAVAVVATRGAISVDVTLEFTGPSRGIAAVVPSIGAPAGACEDVDCWPLFEVTPVHDGPFTAAASWSGPAATLVLLQGRILARSATATGLPYREEARSDGASPRRIATRLSSTGEYALVLRQAPGADALRDVRLDATWP